MFFSSLSFSFFAISCITVSLFSMAFFFSSKYVFLSSFTAAFLWSYFFNSAAASSLA